MLWLLILFASYILSQLQSSVSSAGEFVLTVTTKPDQVTLLYLWLRHDALIDSGSAQRYIAAH